MAVSVCLLGVGTSIELPGIIERQPIFDFGDCVEFALNCGCDFIARFSIMVGDGHQVFFFVSELSPKGFDAELVFLSVFL